MKKLLILSVCILVSALSVAAQDIIVKRDRSVIKAKILSISDKEIQFKRSSYPDGPDYVLPVSDIASITFANGEKQVFESEREKEILEKGITPGMSYRDYKKFYDQRDYVYSPTDRYSPVIAGVCSFLVPGLGQMINGQVGKGIGITLGSIAMITGGCMALIFCKEKNDKGQITLTTGGTACFTACFTGSLVLDIWSIFDAVKVAKIKNLYMRDCQQIIAHDCEIKLMPDLAFTPTASGLQPTAGLRLSVHF